MGVLGLAPFLQKACPNVFKILPKRFGELSGKTVVLDGTLITQRLHFAPMPVAYRHVLGWHRILQELKECGVSSVCVFDGKERSFAKQMEVTRRREVRKLDTARGQLETDRLERLSRLTQVIQVWGELDSRAKESATEALRKVIQGQKPISLPTYIAGSLELLPDSVTTVDDPILFEEYERRHHSYGDFPQEELTDLLKRTGVPVSASGEFDADIFNSITAPSLPSFLSQVASHKAPEDLLEEICASSQKFGAEDMPELLGDIQPDTTSIIQSAEDAFAPMDVDNISSTLTNLYLGYKASLERLNALPQSSSVLSPPGSDDVADARTEYMMSKTQAQLTSDEGEFWTKLTRVHSVTGEDVQEDAIILTHKSHFLSESYSRRSNPPTTQTYDECKEIIRAMGVPCIQTDGPFEAEALAASIVLHGQADFVASEDTDVLVYGAPLIRNIAKRSDPLVIVHGSEVWTALQLDHNRFIDFALLLGTDFSRRIKNVGPHRALKFIREHGTIEEMLQREKQYPPRVAPALYLQEVEVARVAFHTLPPVPDPSTMQNTEPDDDAVQEILHKYGLWKELSHGTEDGLPGNYFNDNPAAT